MGSLSGFCGTKQGSKGVGEVPELREPWGAPMPSWGEDWGGGSHAYLREGWVALWGRRLCRGAAWGARGSAGGQGRVRGQAGGCSVDGGAGGVLGGGGPFLRGG